MAMLLTELKTELVEKINSLSLAKSPSDFMDAARRVCELARSANFVASDAYFPSILETLDVSRVLESAAGIIRAKIEQVELPSHDAGLVSEYADHIYERAMDLRDLASSAMSALPVTRRPRIHQMV
jgi:hypothetical protein